MTKVNKAVFTSEQSAKKEKVDMYEKVRQGYERHMEQLT
jgi:hypothetical protein